MRRNKAKVGAVGMAGVVVCQGLVSGLVGEGCKIGGGRGRMEAWPGLVVGVSEVVGLTGA